jgi:hypothetical protein
MPVERMMGFPVARVWRSRLSSVSEADAILKQGTLKFRWMRSTDASSHAETNQGILADLQNASISA